MWIAGDPDSLPALHDVPVTSAQTSDVAIIVVPAYDPWKLVAVARAARASRGACTRSARSPMWGAILGMALSFALTLVVMLVLKG